MKRARRLTTPAVRLGRRAFVASVLIAGASSGLGRIPASGALRLRVPWPLAELDPHDLYDATAALFGRAVFDPLFALDEAGRPYPALARDLPERLAGAARVVLRPGLVTARARPLRMRDVLWSLRRSRRLGGRALLGAFGEPEPDKKVRNAFVVPGATPEALAVALSSPLTSIIPESASPQRPDGTGAFLATPGADKLVLARNPHAARGSSYLERIDVAPAPTLSDALRSFEAYESDVGWLGAGLHRSRKDARAFTSPAVAFAILRTGAEAGAWGAPGVAQKLVDGIAPSQLAHLGLGVKSPKVSAAAWGGPKAPLFVREDAPYLLEVARIVAAIVTAPGHEVTVAPVSKAEHRRLQRSGGYSLMIDIVRHLGPAPRDGLLSLLAAADPELVRRPPDLARTTAERLTRTLPLGVLGEIRVAGACDASIRDLDGWNLGAAWRAP